MKIHEARLRDIYAHARACFPEECCGLIFGPAGEDIGLVDQVKPITNIQNRLHQTDPAQYPRDARQAYYMAPEEMLAAFREAEEKGMVIKAFFHSHPNEKAYFSQEDTARALVWDEPAYPDATYLIVSIYPERIAEVKGFRWSPEERRFTEVPVTPLHET
ncbi:MAG: M67 family peptidase [Nitrospinota bacterium]|nr:MAG: M67 family peptidase [Nitrospinota bacterium]